MRKGIRRSLDQRDIRRRALAMLMPFYTTRMSTSLTPPSTWTSRVATLAGAFLYNKDVNLIDAPIHVDLKGTNINDTLLFIYIQI
jgi:hypothetical protein